MRSAERMENGGILRVFKSCRSYLKLGKECRSLFYDTLNSHVAIIFIWYMMLSVGLWLPKHYFVAKVLILQGANSILAMGSLSKLK